jgi:hypothetical protein
MPVAYPLPCPATENGPSSKKYWEIGRSSTLA